MFVEVFSTMWIKSRQPDRIVLGEFEILVLTSVTAAGADAYGVTIHEELEQLVPASRDVSIGAVYTTLDRLEQKGLLKSTVGEPTAARGGRAKRFYKLEAAGARALREALGPMQKAWKIVEEGR
jgi:PadR family transcriptional regulator, regulatory protein PadR